MGISPSADRWNALIASIPVVDDPPNIDEIKTAMFAPDPSECQVEMGSCWCWQDAGHDGPHVCGGAFCNGAWNGDDDDTFEIVRWP